MSGGKGSRPITAFVLLTIRTGREYDVIEEIRSINGVREAFITYGVWDAVVWVEISNLNELESVVYQIRKIDGVENTTTLVGV